MSRPSLKTEVRNQKKNNGKPSKPRTVTVEFLVPDTPEPQFGHTIASSVKDEYFTSKDVCKVLKITPDMLGKIVGNINVEPGRIDLGLNLKRNGQYQLLGYVRKVDYDNSDSVNPFEESNIWDVKDKVHLIGSANNTLDTIAEVVSSKWEYSALAVNLISEYQKECPILFENLSRLQHKPKYFVNELLGKQGVKLVEKITEWMRHQPYYHLARTLTGTSSLSK
jgi:hypothetical protein